MLTETEIGCSIPGMTVIKIQIEYRNTRIIEAGYKTSFKVGSRNVERTFDDMNDLDTYLNGVRDGIESTA
jgi:hypothetical protein